MVKAIHAIFEDGVFKPVEQPGLLPNTRVRLVIETLDDNAEKQRQDQSWELIEKLWQNSSFDSQGERLSRDQLHKRR